MASCGVCGDSTYSVKTARSFLLVLSQVLGWGDDGSGRRVPEVAFGGVAFAREVIRQVLRGSPNGLATFSQIGRPLVPEKAGLDKVAIYVRVTPYIWLPSCSVLYCLFLVFVKRVK